jgi:hypothetical protein
MALLTEPWGRSKCTRAQLASFEEAGILRAGCWRIPAAGETTPNPREREFVCFTSHLERGLGFPTSLFFRRFCAYYGIQPSDLGPHSIEQLAIFVAFCECYLGCRPYFPLWQDLFHGRISREEAGGPMLAAGGLTFQLKSKASFFDLMLPAKAASDWKKSWFYVTEATPEDEAAIPRYSANRSEPRHLQVGKLPDDQRMVVDEMLQAIRGLKKKGLQTINLYNCWLGRRLVPLAQRDHYMYQYTGRGDSTKACLDEWKLEDYLPALKKITQAVYVDAQAGVPPYTAKRPAPTVISLSCSQSQRMQSR